MDISVVCGGTVTIFEPNQDRRSLRAPQHASTGQKAFLSPASNGLDQSYRHLKWTASRRPHQYAADNADRCCWGGHTDTSRYCTFFRLADFPSHFAELARSYAGCEDHGA